MRRSFFAAAAILSVLPGALALSTVAVAAPQGDYDAKHQWHDSNWWFHNNPDWIYQHHREWIQLNVQWGHDGDWDDHHHWHARAWWMHHNPAWVHKYHPDWR